MIRMLKWVLFATFIFGAFGSDDRKHAQDLSLGIHNLNCDTDELIYEINTMKIENETHAQNEKHYCQQIIELKADYVNSCVQNQMLKVTMSQNETDKEMKIQKLNVEIDGLKDEINTIKFENETHGKKFCQKINQQKAGHNNLSFKNKNSKVMLQSDTNKEIKIQNLQEENDELKYEINTIKIHKLKGINYCQQLTHQAETLFLENKNLKIKMSQNETDNEIKIQNLNEEIYAFKQEIKSIEIENETRTQKEKFYCQQINQQKADHFTLFLENKNLKIKISQNETDKEIKIQNLTDETDALKEKIKSITIRNKYLEKKINEKSQELIEIKMKIL